MTSKTIWPPNFKDPQSYMTSKFQRPPKLWHLKAYDPLSYMTFKSISLPNFFTSIVICRWSLYWLLSKADPLNWIQVLQGWVSHFSIIFYLQWGCEHLWNMAPLSDDLQGPKSTSSSLFNFFWKELFISPLKYSFYPVDVELHSHGIVPII